MVTHYFGGDARRSAFIIAWDDATIGLEADGGGARFDPSQVAIWTESRRIIFLTAPDAGDILLILFKRYFRDGDETHFRSLCQKGR